MAQPQRRGPWSQNEDKYLMHLVEAQGPLNWVKISQMLGSRTPKQCRERFHQNLKPSLNHEPITAEEGLLIETLVGQLGKRWAEIARRLHNRSDNAVKNWWNGSMNRRRRLVRKNKPPFHDGIEGHSPYSRVPAPLRLPPVAGPHFSAYSSISPTSNRFPGHSSWNLHSGLPSPSTTSPGTDSLRDGAPSLVSDTGSYYSTSPTIGGHPDSPLGFNLPPLRIDVGDGSPRHNDYAHSPKLPSLSTSTRPDPRPSQLRLPPIRDAVPSRSPYMTAPNSPVGLALTSPRMPPPSRGSDTSADKDARMKLNNLLS
ncbi:Homeodomain-like protein [Pseudomassariella vexata]|uniref:Homeodomain-like protein n=1 Tax=Pseudomassariella vexata TaxID=1141098 RepID=A0A1Y2EJ22_9PEZI|nr:Homeodomain-like protein [Pseudomassariella vexata]ORY71540.1 Homeodomain-like protein [Pseudomassariella vexata]